MIWIMAAVYLLAGEHDKNKDVKVHLSNDASNDEGNFFQGSHLFF